jgi:peptidoglycan lytic transglycosylase
MRRTQCNSPSLAASCVVYVLRQAAVRFGIPAGLAVCIISATADRCRADMIVAAKPDAWSLTLLHNANFVSGDNLESVLARYSDAPETIAPSIESWSTTEVPVTAAVAGGFSAKTVTEATERHQDTEANWTDTSVLKSIRYVRDDLESRVTAYQAWLNSWALMALQQRWQNEGADGVPILGIASWYSPRSDSEASETETASGELYDPDSYSAAIRIDLRDQFGGVRFGSNYRPAYALIECAGKQVIAKINDVGPLKPGRVIDLNVRTMRFFDQSLQLGIVENVMVTPLPGEYWVAGPVSTEENAREEALETSDFGLSKSQNFAVASNAPPVVVSNDVETR